MAPAGDGEEAGSRLAAGMQKGESRTMAMCVAAAGVGGALPAGPLPSCTRCPWTVPR